LAVRVEDHPVAYGSFHGDIPKGQYGAGQVEIWDRGTYEPKGDVSAGLDAGKVEVNLHGEKLKGRFALVRMGKPRAKENWLLIKMKDSLARAENGGDVARGHSKESTSKRRKRGPKARVTGEVVVSGKPERVAFTNVGKMMFPEAGVTKGDVLRFYGEIAEYLLPHLKDRPMTLERLPDGLNGPKAPRFWQKNTPSYYPAWIPRVELVSQEGKAVHYALVNDAETLAYLVNQGAITFHPYLSRVGHLDRPDFVLFDLDPGEATFGDAVKIAKKLHGLLDEEKVESFVKTSGKSGLHVLSPWKKEGGFDEARGWALDVAEQAVKALPKLATTERSKAGRKGRVYVDVMQNAEGKHVVPPYVLRAVPRATVSTPLEWDELTAKLNPAKFTMDAVLKRVKRHDPIAGLAADDFTAETRRRGEK
jgi:bifunctional non-homologous end joining protein LigD